MAPPTKRTDATLTAPMERLGSGRLGSYALMGAAVGAVPLPWLPGSIASRIRGALVQDIAMRYGVSLTPEARQTLIEQGITEGSGGFVGSALNFAATRVLSRFGPLMFLSPLRSALLTFALGHLFTRYLQTARDSAAVRIDQIEAKRVRRAINKSLTLLFTTPPRPEHVESVAPEEMRDQITQATDGLLAFAASLPGWVVRRLEAAFDEAIIEH